jgi:hypothetical protein
MGYYQDFGWTDEQAWGGTPDDYDDEPCPPCKGCGCDDCECEAVEEPDDDLWCEACGDWHDDPCEDTQDIGGEG